MMKQMTTIWIVSVIHILWGLSLLFVPESYVPRPFGQLEPYFHVLSIKASGLILCATAVLPFFSWLTWRGRWPLGLLLAIIPQQAMLFYAVGWELDALGESIDGRPWLSFCLQSTLTIFHLTDGWKIVQSARAPNVMARP